VSAPYRDGDHSEPVDAPRDGGIVGDVIAQFADPYAFYRELVQNAIDAGSPEVHVEVTYDASDRKLRVGVRDRGEGMTREVIENQLLVLFRSTKEKDGSKIGKFGVGFASVLSPSPEVVIVNSARDGKRLTLHLYRDLTYELFDAGRATQNGTTVELELAKSAGELAEFERKSHEALVRWCRHASVPIHFSFRRGDREHTRRIDSPLGFGRELVEVTRAFDGGALTVVAGLTEAATPYVGFFNHGLMLHEAGDLLGAVSVKIQDSRLGHTISRDDVRRDGHYDRALRAAREVVDETLRSAVSQQLRERIEAGDERGYGDLLEACVKAKHAPVPWCFPLVDPVAGKTWISPEDLRGHVWTAEGRDELTAALARSGAPVVLRWRASALETALELAGCATGVAGEYLTAVALAEDGAADAWLVSTLTELLDAAHRAPASIVLVHLSGARDDLLAVSLPDTKTLTIDREDATKNPFALFGRRVLALSITHPHVVAARASEDRSVAAAHLARAVLLQYGLLDLDRSQKLVSLALERIGVRA